MNSTENWEVIFVDDNSQDGSLETLQELSSESEHCRYIRRIGRRGLATACMEGMLASPASLFAVMDADMQHDHTKLAEMFTILEKGDAQIVVGTRYAAGGDTGDWGKGRAFISKVATKLAGVVLPVSVTDPMSGFFALNRAVIERVAGRLSGRGFEILVDILLSYGKGLCIVEIPYTFKNVLRARQN